MKILLSGSSGFLGKTLSFFLKEKGHEILRLVRSIKKEEDTIFWNPQEGIIERIPDIDAIIHLSGENVGNGRWTKDKKKKIIDSRVDSTSLLSKALCEMERPPKVWLCASACGFYGSQGEKTLTEEAEKGEGFLSQICQEWEKATEPAKQKGIRVVSLRFGLILSPDGGVLEKMIFPFKMGLGSSLGNGKQYVSWISLPDALTAIYHTISCEAIHGPVNIVAPEPVPNAEFGKILSDVLMRPRLAPDVPALALRVMLGEMADELFLSSIRAIPAKLLETGYSFSHPHLKDALEFLLKKRSVRC